MHGHGSFRPSFSTSSLSPFTMRTPRLTLASDGKPLRRLLVASKPVFEVLCFGLHDTPPQCDPQGGAADYRLLAGPVKSGFGRLTNQANRPWRRAPKDARRTRSG